MKQSYFQKYIKYIFENKMTIYIMKQSYFQKYIKYKRKYLLLLQQGGSVSAKKSDTFDIRLEKSRICVIGAGYGGGDAERWGEVDPNYMGITGMPNLMGTIPGNPIGEFNWNENMIWVGNVFIKFFKKKSFDTLYIDRGTLRAHMDPSTVYNLFRLLSLWINRNFFSIGKVMIPKMDVTFKTTETEPPKFFSESHKQAWKDIIKKHERYSKSIYEWLERVNDEVIIVAGVEFIQYNFKK